MGSSLLDRLHRQVRLGGAAKPVEAEPAAPAESARGGEGACGREGEGQGPAAGRAGTGGVGDPALRARLDALFRRAREFAPPRGPSAARAGAAIASGHEPLLPGNLPAGRPQVIREGPVEHLRLVAPEEPFAATRALGAAEALLLSGDPALASADLSSALFLDLETTGLSRGAGTVAFVVGWARFGAEGLEVHQRVLCRRTGEGELLRELDAELRRSSVLVTFNGKAFDRDLLSVRFAMARVDDRALASVPHLDLLHPARRLLRASLPSCDLRTLERHLFGVVREGDVPGERIPALYRDFLRSGDRSLLDGVVVHNATDLLSLAALPGALARLARAEGPAVGDPAVLLQAGRLHAERGDLDQALRLLAMAAGHPRAGEHGREARRHRSLLLRRMGRHEEARAEWAALRNLAPEDPFGYEEEAKDAEHRRGDLEGALSMVRAFLDRAGGRASPEVRAAFRRRQDRLCRRIEIRRARTGRTASSGASGEGAGTG